MLSFLINLKEKALVNLSTLSAFDIEGNTKDYFLCYYGDKSDIKLPFMKNSTLLHTKQGSLFSMNALNKLIEQENGAPSKDYKIDWSKYDGKLIVMKKNLLNIMKITKIKDVASLLF